MIFNSAIDAILESASPRKPRLLILVRSSTLNILLVLCLIIASGNSAKPIPEPLSDTIISSTPALKTSIFIFVAPASMLFSTSSLTIEAGRSITSPAAILFAISSGRIF